MDIEYGDIYPPESDVRFAGGVPIITTYVDIHQFPVIGNRGLFDNTPVNIGSADAEGQVAFQIALHPEPDCGTIGVSVGMDQIIRQSNPVLFSRASSSLFVMVPCQNNKQV
jgi:hypothetical protein